MLLGTLLATRGANPISPRVQFSCRAMRKEIQTWGAQFIHFADGRIR